MAARDPSEGTTELSIEQQYRLMEKQLGKLASKERGIVIPRNDYFTRSDVVRAFASAFDMIGGVPRMALWAHENPGDFYKLMAKMLPPGQSVNLISSIADNIKEMSDQELLARADQLRAEAEAMANNVEYVDFSMRQAPEGTVSE